MYARPINTQPIPIRTLPLEMNHTPNTIHKEAKTRYLTRPGLGSELSGAFRLMRTSLREADHAEFDGIRRAAVRAAWIARTPWRELAEQERIQRCRCKVAKDLGFGLQGIARVTAWRAHPDRDVRLRHLAAEVAAPAAGGRPVVPVDAKKEELVGTGHDTSAFTVSALRAW